MYRDARAPPSPARACVAGIDVVAVANTVAVAILSTTIAAVIAILIVIHRITVVAIVRGGHTLRPALLPLLLLLLRVQCGG